jgi:hypothetical protein
MGLATSLASIQGPGPARDRYSSLRLYEAVRSLTCKYFPAARKGSPHCCRPQTEVLSPQLTVLAQHLQTEPAHLSRFHIMLAAPLLLVGFIEQFVETHFHYLASSGCVEPRYKATQFS